MKTSFRMPATWDVAGLEAIGFQGFVPLVGIHPQRIPTGHGVYVVLRPDHEQPYELRPDNPLTKVGLTRYTVADLERRWIVGTPVVYIGKAMSAKGLHERIRQYSRKSNGHSGGRGIWQLADADELLVAWVETPNHVAKDVETDLIAAFKLRYARGPFANVSEA